MVFFVLVFLFFKCTFADRCAYEERCSCDNTTISCYEEDLFNVPFFTSVERKFAEKLNLGRTRVHDVPHMSIKEWPRLKVSGYCFMKYVY